MKRFNFRLQRVIDVRQSKEKECQRELSRSQQELLRQENRLQKCALESKKSREGLKKALERPSNIGKLIALDKWRNRQEDELDRQSDRTRKQQVVVEDKRKELVQASKEKKILERLRERRLEEHRMAVQREEQAFLDELGCRIGRSWGRFQEADEVRNEKRD